LLVPRYVNPLRCGLCTGIEAHAAIRRKISTYPMQDATCFAQRRAQSEHSRCKLAILTLFATSKRRYERSSGERRKRTDLQRKGPAEGMLSDGRSINSR